MKLTVGQGDGQIDHRKSQRTACEIFDIAPDKVTREMRRAAKTVNFGVIYGMSAFGLSESLGVPRHEAEGFITRYFERHPGIRAFLDRMTAEGLERGFVSTLFGRKRPVRCRNKACESTTEIRRT